jgi:ABC-type multidrug transport system fused ATPase/permease subunit
MFDGTLRKNLDPSQRGLSLFCCFFETDYPKVSDDEIVTLLNKMKLETITVCLDGQGFDFCVCVAALHNVIRAVPELSQGQKQLLCIARAALHMLHGLCCFFHPLFLVFYVWAFQVAKFS